METEKATNLFGVPLVICTILGAKFTLWIKIQATFHEYIGCKKNSRRNIRILYGVKCVYVGRSYHSNKYKT